MLESEQIEFQIRALDDFGVKQVGMEWNVIEENQSIEPQRGEFMLAAGSPTITRWTDRPRSKRPR